LNVFEGIDGAVVLPIQEKIPAWTPSLVAVIPPAAVNEPGKDILPPELSVAVAEGVCEP
jgi:hypothetical protein